MPNRQSDGKNKLKRIEFSYQGMAYKFVLNPEEYVSPRPNRVTLTQTKGGAWIDEFGPGVPTIQIKGTTGFKNGTKSPTKGYEKFVELQGFLLNNVYQRVTHGEEIPTKKEMKFYNYTDGEYWVVTPSVFTISRSIARPLLYVYDIQLICQRRLSSPNDKDKSSAKSIVGDRKVK